MPEFLRNLCAVAEFPFQRVEASALRHPGAAGLRGPTPLLRLQSDERLIALVRRGNHAAFEALVARYQARLLAFCRHMLGSREDAEDVLQEVFAAAFNAVLADDRPINVRPWLYRIARNRSLNHLRRQTAIGVDSMDVHLAENGTTMVMGREGYFCCAYAGPNGPARAMPRTTWSAFTVSSSSRVLTG